MKLGIFLAWPHTQKCIKQLLICFLGLAATLTHGNELIVALAVDTNASSLQLTLTVQGESDSDTQALGGSLLLAVDCFAPLAAASLRDFHVNAVTNFDLHISYGAFGDLFGSAANLAIRHGDPGAHQPYEPVSGGMITFHEIRNMLGGTAAYRATGLPCIVLQGNGYPCEDTILLANQTTTPIGQIPGTLVISNGVLQFTGNFDFGPVAVVGGGATLSGVATITANGVVQPCLRIEQGPFLDDHRVSWSTAFRDFRLVRATSLTAPVHWEEAVPFTGLDDGATTNALFESLPGTMFFYRLENRPPSSVLPQR